VPDGDEKILPPTEETTLWKVMVGTRKAGPFTRAKLRQLVDADGLLDNAFVRDEAGTTDWFEVTTCDWLFDSPERRTVRYCSECGSRVIISISSADKPRRCPGCSAPGTFVDFLNTTADPSLDRVPVEPWGKFDTLLIAAAIVALAAGFFGAMSLLWKPPFAVLVGSIFLAAGAGLFSVTFHYRSQWSKYRAHLLKVESELDSRTKQLGDAVSELNSLKRHLVEVRDYLIKETEDEFRQRRAELAEELETAKDSVNAVHRMAERFLDETRKWWTSKLTGENFQSTKERITKAIAFCRKQGYSVSTKQERELITQLMADYESVLKRERDRSEQARFREKIREDQKVERERKQAEERIEAEQRAIERAIADTLKRTGDEHSAEIEALREQLKEAEARGQRTKALAEMTKAGHVYVISNVGSFGENVFKVGLTRRAYPEDRVKELGDASVPFTFDIHMMIRCDDAPKLEFNLHRSLHQYRVNRVNFRKEFFKVDIETIRRVIEANHGVVEYTVDPEALAYRESLRISDEELLLRVAEVSSIEDADEDDDMEGRDELLPVDGK